MANETLLTRTLVQIADNLVEDFDIVDLLTLLVDRSVEVLDISAVGLMLVDSGDQLRLMASTSEAMRVLELFELQSAEGPCLDCHRTGQPVLNVDLADASEWPTFAPAALEAGFRSAHAVPMRLRGKVIGALNLFHHERSELTHDDLTACQALADMATISILQHRAAIEAQTTNTQLEAALTSRVIIEQAKGIVFEQANIEMPEAFERLRAHARANKRRLADVAQAVIDGDLSAADLSSQL